jgi:hypothetical protein
MRAPTNLHILATASGLSDEAVVELWNKAREQAISEVGDDRHPAYREVSEKHMVRLIEAEATDGVPPNLVPAVLFDIHVGMAIVAVRNGIKNAYQHVRESISGKHAA